MKEFCGDNCQYLSITEKDQNLYKIGKPDHVCRRYDKRLLHLKSHPKIHKCKKCLESIKHSPVSSEGCKKATWLRVLNKVKTDREG